MSSLSPEAPVELSAHLLHDLRTPVNAILGYANLLVEDTPDDVELQRRVEPVRQSGERLNDLIGTLPRSGPLPADWLPSMRAPLAELETGIAGLRSWDGAPQEDVDHIETARGRLLELLARLAVNDDPTRLRKRSPAAVGAAHRCRSRRRAAYRQQHSDRRRQ